MRKGIRAVLEEYVDIRVVGEASNGLEAVQYAKQFQPAVIVMDVNMPHMDGVQATRLIKEEQPAVIIIGLSVNKAGSVREAMLRAGASEYLNKENVGVHLYNTICRILANTTP
jgi:two-component system response regulator DegU